MTIAPDPDPNSLEPRWPDRERSGIRRRAQEFRVLRAATLLYVDVFEDEVGQTLLALLDAIARRRSVRGF